MITAEWKSRAKELPDSDRPVLACSTKYSFDHGLRYRLVSGLSVRHLCDIDYWVYVEDLEPDPELIF